MYKFEHRRAVPAPTTLQSPGTGCDRGVRILAARDRTTRGGLQPKGTRARTSMPVFFFDVCAQGRLGGRRGRARTRQRRGGLPEGVRRHPEPHGRAGARRGAPAGGTASWSRTRRGPFCSISRSARPSTGGSHLVAHEAAPRHRHRVRHERVGQAWTMRSLMRVASVSSTNGLVRTCMPGRRYPFPSTAFSA